MRRALVLISSRYGSAADLGVFASVARLIPGADAARVETGADLLEALDEAPPATYDHVVIAGHGGPTWVIHPRHGVTVGDARREDQVGASDLAAAMARVLRRRDGGRGRWPLVSLAACLCSRAPRWWLRAHGRSLADWGPRAYEPGGQASLAARLRDWLAWYGCPARVRGHRAAGHAYYLALLAEHRWPAGALCSPLFQRALPDVEPTRAVRRRWVELVTGELAARWLLGDDPVEGEIRGRW